MGHALGVGDTNDTGRVWRKSSRSYGSGSCVEVAAPRGEHIYVRDSTDPNGVVLIFSRAQWNSFAASMCGGPRALCGINGVGFSTRAKRNRLRTRTAISA